MGKSINKVILHGRAGKDAQIRAAGSHQVISFSLATGGGKKKDGSEYPTDWHQIEAWNSDTAKSVTKGADVEVEGRLRYDSWDDRATGQKKFMTKIVANSIVIGGNAAPLQPQGSGYTPKPKVEDIFNDTPSAKKPTLKQQDYSNDEITDDDIPF